MKAGKDTLRACISPPASTSILTISNDAKEHAQCRGVSMGLSDGRSCYNNNKKEKEKAKKKS